MGIKHFYSIIVPVYNVERYLRKCIDSILAQQNTDFELILVDDGSTDSSGEICDEYVCDCRVNVFHKDNAGVSVARNYGRKYINGKYVLYIDSDDYLESPLFLNHAELLLRNNSNTDVLIFGYKKYFEIDQTFKEYCPRIKGQYSICDFIGLINKELYVLSPWGKIVRADIIKKDGLDFEKGVLCEDMLWCIKLALVSKRYLVVKDSPYIYRQRINSISNTSTNQKINDIKRNFEKSIYLVQREKMSSDLMSSFYAFISQYYSMFIICLAERKKEEQKRHFEFMDKHKRILKYAVRKREKLLRAMLCLLGKRTTLVLIESARKNRR